MASFEDKKQALARQIREAAGEVRLQKTTSNLFRDRVAHRAAKLDVHLFNRVLAVDPDAGTFEAEGMTTYQQLADATFARGVGRDPRIFGRILG